MEKFGTRLTNTIPWKSQNMYVKHVVNHVMYATKWDQTGSRFHHFWIWLLRCSEPYEYYQIRGLAQLLHMRTKYHVDLPLYGVKVSGTSDIVEHFLNTLGMPRSKAWMNFQVSKSRISENKSEDPTVPNRIWHLNKSPTEYGIWKSHQQKSRI